MRVISLAALCGALFLIVSSGAAQTALDQAELVYTPMTPCRAFDTSVVGGRIAANTTRNFRVLGSSTLVTQGGPKAGCGVPTYATAVSINVTATGAAAGGYFQAFPYQTARPVTKTLYYGANATALSAAIVGVNKAYISLFTSQAAHAVGEVTGFFAPPIRALILYDGTVSYSSRPLTSQNFDSGSYVVTPDRDISSCTSFVTPTSGAIAADTYYESSTNRLYVHTVQISGAGVSQNSGFALRIDC